MSVPAPLQVSAAKTRVARTAEGAGFLLQRKCAACQVSDSALSGLEEEEPRRESKPLQPKLRFSLPGDVYEREADRLADAVVSVPEPAMARGRGDARAGMPVYRQVTPLGMRKTAPSPVVPEEERKGEEEPPVQAKRADSAVLQRQACCGREEDALSGQAFSGDSRILQRQELPEEKEEVLQAKPSDGAQSLGEHSGGAEPRTHGTQALGAEVDFDAGLAAEEPGGSALEPGVRTFMENRFGVDFGQVRVHAGAAAAGLARSVQAEAFTLGQHVYFGAGYYDPASSRGRRLLAHELVHTIQQARGSARRARPEVPPLAAPLPDRGSEPPIETEPAASVATDSPLIQRRAVDDTFVPERLPDGTFVHQDLLARIGKEKGNEDLFTEVKIPGATASGLAENAGRADFYQVAEGNKTTIALIMLNGEPHYLESHFKHLSTHKVNSMLLKGGHKFEHKKLGAPRGIGDKETGCDGEQGVKVCRLDQAPGTILFGDLKPPPSLEKFLEATIQIGNYREGLKKTKTDLNRFIRGNPAAARPKGMTWEPDTGLISSIAIPENLTTSTKKKVGLRLYGGRKEDLPIEGLEGPLVVYKDKTEPGVWNYDWIPTKIPPNLRTDAGSTRVTKALARIDELIEQLKAPPAKTEGGKQALRNAPSAPSRRRSRFSEGLIQRKGKAFDAKTWRADYKKWQESEATELLGSEGVGLTGLAKTPVRESKEARSLRVVQGLLALQDRVPAKHLSPEYLRLPKSFQTAARGFKRIRLWARFGGLFGRARSVFGGVFLKIVELYEKARTKFEEIRAKHKSRAPTDSDKIIGAFLKAAFQVGVLFIKTMVHRVTDQLKKSLAKAGEVLLKDFLGEDNVAKLVETKENFEQFVQDIEAKGDAIRAPIDELVKPYEGIFEIIAKVREWAGKISTYVSAIKWGLRIVQCLTPPGIGCLKLIVQKLAEELVGELADRVTKTCWFRLNFLKPLFGKIQLLSEIPAKISNFILGFVKGLVGGLPFGFSQDILNQAFPEIKVSTNLTARDLECDSGKITPAQREMNKLVDSYGMARVRELIKLLEAGGLTDESRDMTVDDVKLLRGLLEKIDGGEVTEEQLSDATKNLREGRSSGVKDVDDLLGRLGIGTGSEGGGTEQAAGGPGIKTVPYRKVTTRSKGGGGKAAGLGLYAEGCDLDHRKDSEQSITVIALANGDPALSITGVPAKVVDVRDVEEGGAKSRKFRYRLKESIKIDTKVKGVEVGIYGPDQNPLTCTVELSGPAAPP